MKKLLSLVVALVLVGFCVQGAEAIGFNERARTYVGWEEGYLGFSPVPQSTWMVVKWSKDWNFPFGEGSPEGAWLTVHFVWYTNNISAGFFGHDEGSLVYWGNPDTVPEAKYRVEEYSKVMILNNPEKYEEKGAVPANELGYPFPDNAYVVHWSVEIYNATTGKLLFEVSLVPSLD